MQEKIVCKVVVYSASWCVGCKTIKKILEQNYVDYQEIDIDTDEGMRMAKDLGIRNIPVTFIGDGRFVGSSPEVIQRILKEIK